MGSGLGRAAPLLAVRRWETGSLFDWKKSKRHGVGLEGFITADIAWLR